VEKNSLRHILGGGKSRNPKFLFLFINPTHLNISSLKNYQGKRRYPFIGVRYFWKLLSEASFIDRKIVDEIYREGWQVEHEDKIEQSLNRNSVYVTNLVKCAQFHPDNPIKSVITEDIPLLKEEISIIRPKYIIAFGKLPVKVITGQDIRLSDYLEAVKTDQYQALNSISIFGKFYKVLPCYFPVGRGSPKKALEILRYVKRKFD